MMHPPTTQRTAEGQPIAEDQLPEGESGKAPDDAGTGLILPPGQHRYDPIKKDLDPIGFALERVQTFLAWIAEHRASFEEARADDPELAEAELANLRDATWQGMMYLQRLSELLLAGYTIDPSKRLPDSLRRGSFSSLVTRCEDRRRAAEAEARTGSEDAVDPRNGEPAPPRGSPDIPRPASP